MADNHMGKENTSKNMTNDVYLVVLNDSEEFQISLRYTARLAHKNRAHVGILAVLDDQEFQHWKNVENMMRKELRETTEKKMWTMARKIHDLNGQIPVFYIREGQAEDAVLKALEENSNIKMMVLTGGVSSGGPGALVNYFTSKGLNKLKIPYVIVPGNITNYEIDELFDIIVTE